MVQNRSQAWSRKRRITVRLLLIIGGLLVGTLIAEIGFRIVGYDYPEFYRADEHRGYALNPGVEGWYRKEGEAYIRINSEGLRDVEHSKQKPADTVRIAVLGDSYAEALHVPMENAFWSVLGTKLEECRSFGGKKIEVINFGVSGYGTAQELITLRQKVWDYSPDIVVLALTTANDISDNSRTLRKTNQIPYFIYREGQLVLDDSFKDTKQFRLRRSVAGKVGAWMMKHLRIVQAMAQAVLLLHRSQRQPAQNSLSMMGMQPSVSEPNFNGQPVRGEEPGIDNMIYLEPRNQAWNDAWRVTEGLIKLMRDEVKGKGATFVVVTLSTWIQLHPDLQGRRAFHENVGATDLFYADRRIKSLGEIEGIPVINLAQAMQAYADQHQVFLHGTIGGGHWNRLGHRIAGEMIARGVCDIKGKDPGNIPTLLMKSPAIHRH